MYEAVRKERRSKVGVAIWLGLAFSVLVIALVVTPMFWGGWYQQRWWAFVSDLSDSTTYAYDHNCLRADWRERSIRVDGESTYRIYTIIAQAKGRPVEPPDREPDAKLIYGDGSLLYLWHSDLAGYQEPPADGGTVVRYVNQEGKVFSFDTDRYTIPDLLDPAFSRPGGAQSWDSKEGS